MNYSVEIITKTDKILGKAFESKEEAEIFILLEAEK
jgi:hypothetical protein